MLDHTGQIVKPVTNEKLRAVDITTVLKEPYRDSENKSLVQMHREEANVARRRDRFWSTCSTFTWKRGCTASIAISSKTTMAIHDCSAKCEPPSRSNATIATARSAYTRRCAPSGPAAYTSSPDGSRDLTSLRTPFGRRQFEREADKIYQNSMIEENLRPIPIPTHPRRIALSWPCAT